MADLNLWGKAYALSGNVNAVITVNDVEVFNGEVTTTSSSTPTHSVAEKIASVTVSDSLLGTTASVEINVTGGDLILMGFGSDEYAFGSNPGQLKSNVSVNGDEPYNVTDEDVIDSGVYIAEGANPGEFHITIADGWTVSFDNEFPAA